MFGKKDTISVMTAPAKEKNLNTGFARPPCHSQNIRIPQSRRVDILMLLNPAETGDAIPIKGGHFKILRRAGRVHDF